MGLVVHEGAVERGQAATGEFVMLLNNDTEVAPDFLEPVIAAAQADPSIGALGPKIRYFDRPEVIQYAGGHPIDLWRGRGGWRGWGEEDRGQYMCQINTDPMTAQVCLGKIF